ncbi:WD40-repeat-containing domain protein [Pisolithus marmoratus]|nr:WD40-repeat-containing domain protein [Pisolithus marmoratus]
MNASQAPNTVVQTPGFAHYSVAWSPFHNHRLAVASAANFGLVGNGRLHTVSLVPGPRGTHGVKVDKFFETQDALYDVAWSEVHENQLVGSSGDGSIKMWDITLNDFPMRSWREHTREVFSVDWSNIRKDTFLSSSWDGNVKLWTPDRPRSVTTLQAHQSCVYQALFSPHHSDMLATCSTDGTIKIFDLRNPAYASGPSSNSFTNPVSAAALTIPASATELLSLDWNKYRPFLIASAGVDRLIKSWDCRMVANAPPSSEAVGGLCEHQVPGHEYAIRKVQWSPHRADVLATASYDMTCRIWTMNPQPGRAHLLNIHDSHTEFVGGCGWSLFDEDLIANDPEDILSSSLQTLYDFTPITHSTPGSIFTYIIEPTLLPISNAARVIELETPDPQPSKWDLHASSIWIAAVYLADHIEDLELHRFQDREVVRVLELGAVSDYPDEHLIRTLSENILQNGVSGVARAVPYDWGTNISALVDAYGDRETPQNDVLFDVIIAADTLWNPALHKQFIQSLIMSLKRSPDSRVYLVAGLHTGRYTIQAFLRSIETDGCGLVVESLSERQVTAAQTSRSWDVTRAENEDERERRRWIVWIVLKWGENDLS